jgi:hypothetical protein
MKALRQGFSEPLPQKRHGVPGFGRTPGKFENYALSWAWRLRLQPGPTLLQWVNGKPGRFPSNPHGSIRMVEVRGQPLLSNPPPDHPGFPLYRPAYFFLAARPRPAGAARNEMPVRIAFC